MSHNINIIGTQETVRKLFATCFQHHGFDGSLAMMLFQHHNDLRCGEHIINARVYTHDTHDKYREKEQTNRNISVIVFDSAKEDVDRVLTTNTFTSFPSDTIFIDTNAALGDAYKSAFKDSINTVLQLPSADFQEKFLTAVSSRKRCFSSLGFLPPAMQSPRKADDADSATTGLRYS